jgi:hypothetical protein
MGGGLFSGLRNLIDGLWVWAWYNSFMAMTKEQILTEAMALNPRDRETVAEELLLSLSDSDRQAIDDAWLAEARRRDAAFANGQVKASPINDVVGRVLSRTMRRGITPIEADGVDAAEKAERLGHQIVRF